MVKHTGPANQLRNHRVSHFRLIRTVANLLLIVTMMIQPLVVCASESRRATKAFCSVTSTTDTSTTSVTCAGCDSCQVDEPDDLCGCCSKSTSEESCCSDATADSDDSSGHVHSTCVCNQHVPPLGDSSPKRPTNENRDQVLTDSTFANVDQDDLRDGRDRMVIGRSAPTRLRFSQRMLCVWRL